MAVLRHEATREEASMKIWNKVPTRVRRVMDCVIESGEVPQDETFLKNNTSVFEIMDESADIGAAKL